MPSHPSALSPNLLGLPRSPTVSRFLDFWLAHVAWSELRFATARTYSSVVVHLLSPVLGELRVARLRSSDVEKAQVLWQRAGVTVWMRRKAVEVLRSALNHAVALALRAALLRQRGRERKKALAASSTLRPEDPVMTTRTRRAYWTGYLYYDLRERLVRLGLPKLRLHDLRHTAASLLLSEGVPPRTVMEMMGHRNLEVTMFIYGHTNLRHQRDAVATLDRALRRYRITCWGASRDSNAA